MDTSKLTSFKSHVTQISNVSQSLFRTPPERLFYNVKRYKCNLEFTGTRSVFTEPLCTQACIGTYSDVTVLRNPNSVIYNIVLLSSRATKDTKRYTLFCATVAATNDIFRDSRGYARYFVRQSRRRTIYLSRYIALV